MLGSARSGREHGAWRLADAPRAIADGDQDGARAARLEDGLRACPGRVQQRLAPVLNRQADYQANAKCYRQKNMAEPIVLNADTPAVGICLRKAIL